MKRSVKSMAAGLAALAAVSIAVAKPASAESFSSVVLQAAPKGAQLSAEEEVAVDNKNAGKPYDKQAYNRAMQKIKQAEKFDGDRNKQKRGRK